MPVFTNSVEIQTLAEWS